MSLDTYLLLEYQSIFTALKKSSFTNEMMYEGWGKGKDFEPEPDTPYPWDSFY